MGQRSGGEQAFDSWIQATCQKERCTFTDTGGTDSQPGTRQSFKQAEQDQATDTKRRDSLGVQVETLADHFGLCLKECFDYFG